jgi:alpha-beta hydrolase superfamily lysophospholipase
MCTMSMEARVTRRTAVAAAVTAAVLLIGAGSSPAATQEMPDVRVGPRGSAFYDPPARLPAGRPGTPIWARPTQAPKGANAWKVLYKSTLHDGRAVAVSGLVIAPKGKAKKGRPVVAWAHGTLGGARGCAPSIPANPARDLEDYYTYQSSYTIDVGVPALSELLKAGYVVTATDYQGLGTPGVHQYTVVGTEANNVLDSVKAAQRLPGAGTGSDVVVLGWSQGGGAAIYAGQTGKASYAKGLRVRGIAALAPAANTGPDILGLVAPGPTSSLSPSVTAVQQLNAFRGFAAAYANLKLADVVAEPGMAPLKALDNQCTIHLGDVVQELEVDPATFFKRPLPTAWRARFEQNTDGNQATVAPVLVMQGTADTVVNPNGSTQYAQRACRFGQPVQYSVYPGENHQTIPFAAQSQYVRWIADRFAGRKAPTNC